MVYNLADCVKQYDAHEAETLTAIVEGRGSAGDIENVTTAIAAVSEAYPELKSNENYKELMNELSMTENLIAECRSNYNKQIKEYNRYVRKFPTRVFLNMLGYEVQEYNYLDYEAPVDAPQNLFGE
ncbi:MAG: LemA family protein [Erysipelotrichaceae bacterium]|nr:LemA family protein [Erysipelotrichaceae bacterium]